jgi:histidinol-phosphate/aromatic aminotransferase/cobyric acid decarboxylase-like protein
MGTAPLSLRLHGDSLARPGMLDFAVNVWPAPRPAALERALQRALLESHRYPNEREAIEAIAHRHARPAGEVLLLNGACDAFWALAHAFRPNCAVCIHPGFTEAEAALAATAGKVIRVLREPSRWRFDPNDIPDETDCLVLGNPNNPTGTLEPPEALAALARPGRLLVVDESFIDFVPSPAASLAGRSDIPGLIVIRSLTKLWALPGIRAGYLLAHSDIVRRLAAERQPWSTNSLACAALTTCATDRKTPNNVAREVASERAKLARALKQLPGLEVWPSEANFLLVRTPDGPGLVESLRQRGIAVRPCATFPGLDDRYIRLAVRTSTDNETLLEALEEILADHRRR